MAVDPDFWRGRRVLLTGHTGFKGAWLSLWLQRLGARVTGLAPGPPRDPSLYALARVGTGMEEIAADVRDRSALRSAFTGSDPEMVLHLAAQPLVSRALADPVLTYEVNLLGTVNVLEAARERGGQVAIVLVTSDKCYENAGGRPGGFVEEDPLGGADPYSSSKACAELAAAAYRRSFFESVQTPLLASARAGNVIGGGDWGANRLVPDAVRAVESGATLAVRNPDATRPWQHVLNPLQGYLLLAQELSADRARARAWNFGPPPAEARPVGWIVRRLEQLWQGELRWAPDGEPALSVEAGRLEIDSSRARRELGWSPALTLEQALELLVDWHRAHRRGEDMRQRSLAQLDSLA